MSDENHIDLSSLPSSTYVSFAQMGNCKICNNYKDLRMGSCFPCSDFVDMEKILGGHKLWDSRNPENFWYYREN